MLLIYCHTLFSFYFPTCYQTKSRHKTSPQNKHGKALKLLQSTCSGHFHKFFTDRLKCVISSCEDTGCGHAPPHRPSLPPFTLKTRPVSSHQGRGAFSMSTWGQVVFRSHSCSAPPAHLLTCSDRQILPCCLRTNGPIHVEAPTDIVRLGGGGDTVPMPGKALGSGRLDLATSSPPI